MYEQRNCNSSQFNFNIYQLRNGYLYVKDIYRYVNEENACKVAMVKELRNALACSVLIKTL